MLKEMELTVILLSVSRHFNLSSLSYAHAMPQICQKDKAEKFLIYP